MTYETSNLERLTDVPANYRVGRDKNGTGFCYRNFIAAAHMPFATSTRQLKAGFFFLPDYAAAAIAMRHVDADTARITEQRDAYLATIAKLVPVKYPKSDKMYLVTPEDKARLENGEFALSSMQDADTERWIRQYDERIARNAKAKARYAKIAGAPAPTTESKEDTMPSKTATESVAARRLRLREAAKTSQAKLATKRAAAKTAPKAKAKSAPAPTAQSRENVQAENERLTKVLMTGLASGKSLSDMATELGRPAGKLALLKMIAEVAPADRITGTDAAVAKAIVKARNAGQSWGLIMARTGLAEGSVRKIYTDSTGEATQGLRVGKGGRLPSDPKVAAKVARPAAKAPAAKKAAPAKAKPASKGNATTRSPRAARRAGVQTVK